MPTPLNNQASVSYVYEGAAAPSTASSNVTTTTLLDEYTLLATKSTLTNTYRPGENITYVIRLENNGRGDLYNVTISDNLGGTPKRLEYLASSAALYLNGNKMTITAVENSDDLTLTLPMPLCPGDVALVLYVATVNTNVPLNVNAISNTAVVTANGGSSTGAMITVTPNPSATIVRQAYAELAIYKQADKQNVVPGELLTYTFTITNTGNQDAIGVVLTDTLPTGFAVNLVTATTGGVTVTYSDAEYDIIDVNTITLPNASGASITVPKAVGDTPGVTTIVITGTITSEES